MTRPYQVAVDLGPELHCKFEKAAQAFGLAKSDFLRAAVAHALECNAIIEYYTNMGESPSKDQKGINKYKKSTIKTSMWGLTEDDWDVINAFRTTYNLPPRSKMHWAAVSKVIKAARKNGITQEELLEMVRKSPQHEFVISTLQRGGKPTLSGLLSEKMINQLLTLTWGSTREFGQMTKVEFENYKMDMMSEHLPSVPPEKKAVFYNRISVAENTEEVEAIINEYVS